ncbi:unnamed protein product [Cylindrotheca closterium]|uniref:Uncharacterized protein n=1 Tax=Cylindrotheca closterium TaxID=2856 RepID=A0AAD2FMX3_9STRA|nr:unnamed protein product [Cylindrotheca closterium]
MSASSSCTELETKLQRSSSSMAPSLASLSSSSFRSLTSADDSNHSSKDKETKRVSWSEIDVVELPMILGDHPACRDGLPVQPGWISSDRYSVSVDSFEETRSPRRRSGSKLYISSFDRLKLIRNIPLRDETSPQLIQVDDEVFKPDSNEILCNVAPPPITLDEDSDHSNSNRGDEIRRVERRLDVANTRFDKLTSRMDDLELIRKERIERRQRRRQAVPKLE